MARAGDRDVWAAVYLLLLVLLTVGLVALPVVLYYRCRHSNCVTQEDLE